MKIKNSTSQKITEFKNTKLIVGETYYCERGGNFCVEPELLHVNNSYYVGRKNDMSGFEESMEDSNRRINDHHNFNMHMSEVLSNRRQSNVWYGGCLKDNK